MGKASRHLCQCFAVQVDLWSNRVENLAPMLLVPIDATDDRTLSFQRHQGAGGAHT